MKYLIKIRNTNNPADKGKDVCRVKAEGDARNILHELNISVRFAPLEYYLIKE